MIEVLAPGPAAFVEDLGRFGWASLGVGRSGAADRGALERGNRLLANPPDAAGVEATLGGLCVRFGGDHVFALTGAPVPATLAGVPVGGGVVLRARRGDELRLGLPVEGLRTYLVVRGGIAVTPVLGSRSWDVLAGLGPAPLHAGDVLPVGAADPVGPVAERLLPARTAATGPGAARTPVTVELLPGLRWEWFGPQVLGTLTAAPYRVTPESNRIAVRLDGAELARADVGEYVSEGLVRGAVQVPPSGLPVVFLSDHPVTGGYPVAGVVEPSGVDALAQLRPGDAVRFRRAARPDGRLTTASPYGARPGR